MVLLRRFSAKEEKRRLIAAPLLKSNFNCDFIGLENHVNYIYRKNGKMTEQEAHGIAALLNSSLLDNYFRISNGNTQVSATEIRAFPMPSIEMIRTIGQRIMKIKHIPTYDEIDRLVRNAINRK
jgi:adenine-specific DNA-methyltransferase